MPAAKPDTMLHARIRADTRRRLDEMCDAYGLKVQDAVGRLLDWWASRSEPARKAIMFGLSRDDLLAMLDDHPDPAESAPETAADADSLLRETADAVRAKERTGTHPKPARAKRA